MGEYSGFFPDVAGDREYTTDFLAKFIHSFVGNGVYNGDLAVTADGLGMFVTVPAGQAWINGYYYNNDGPKVIPVAVADGMYARKDIVVLRFSVSTRDITALVLTGTPGTFPIAPTLVRNAEIYDLQLALIDIPAGATAVQQAHITDKRSDETVCGFVAALIQQLDTAALFQQFQDSFNQWFTGIKGKLGTDVAGSLQAQIDDLNSDVTGMQETVNSAKALALSVYPTGGTGTAITVSISAITAYAGNQSFSFLAGAANGSAETTLKVNALAALPVYAQGKTTPPAIYANKLYTVYLNAGATCFYLVEYSPVKFKTGSNFTTAELAEGEIGFVY